MIILGNKFFARRDYEGLSKDQASRLKKYRSDYAKDLRKAYREGQMERSKIVGTAPEKISSHYNLRAADKNMKLDVLMKQAKDKSGKSIFKDGVITRGTGGLYREIGTYEGKWAKESASDYANRFKRIHSINTRGGLRNITGHAKEYMRDKAIKDSAEEAKRMELHNLILKSEGTAKSNASKAVKSQAKKVNILKGLSKRNIKTAGKIALGTAALAGTGYLARKAYKHYKNKNNDTPK